MRSARKGEGDYGVKDLWKKGKFWVWSDGVMHSESGDDVDNDDDDELVRERWDDSDRDK